MSESAPERRFKNWVGFRYALPDVVVTTMLVLGSSTRREGLDPWVTRTYAELSPDLRQELQELFLPFGGPMIISHLTAEAPALDDFSSFVGWLASLDPGRVTAFTNDILVWWGQEVFGLSDERAEIDAGDDAAVRERLRQIHELRAPETKPDLDRFHHVLRLLRDPSELKARLIYLLIRFWEGHFKAEYAECARTIERNIAYHHERVFEEDFREFYFHVTSQHLRQADADAYPSPELITFIPSCYAGAAVILVPFGSGRKRFALIYNCRVPGRAGGARIAIRDLYAPLKALADETRLEILSLLDGTERYGQEIVDSLDVGQSTVSRHLQLLVQSGVVLERKSRGMKYYRINGEALSQLSRLLTTYRSAESPKE